MGRPLLTSICLLLLFLNMAYTLASIIARQCESEWCLPGLPSIDPVGALIGGAAAGWGMINNFVIPPPTTTKEDSDTLFRTTLDTEQNMVAPVNEEQCQNLPGWQSGQVSLLL